MRLFSKRWIGSKGLVASILFITVLCQANAFAGVTVSSPTTSSVISPVHFVASATPSSSSAHITAMRIYVDSVSAYTTSASSLNAYLNLASGNHTATIKAWDNYGNVYRKSLKVSVGLSVAVTPGSTMLFPGQNKQFNATVTANGLYIAPSTAVTSPVVLTVTAKSVADSTLSSSATVTINPQTTNKVVLSVSPTSASLTAGATQQFTATATGTTNTGVIWQVNGQQGGNSTVGTISTSGMYTAPTCSSTSSATITSVSTYDSTANASATVTISGISTTSGNYYVATSGSDSNDGSSCHPWATIQHAADIVGPGDTVHVAPGSYAGNIVTGTSGTESARIRFVSDQQWGAKVSTSNYTVWHNTGNYVDIMGFDISGSGCLGINNEALHNSRVIGNHVHDIVANVSTTCGSNGGSGIVSSNYSGYDNDILDNVVHDIGWTTGPNQSVQGIYHSNLRGHIYNNTVYRCAAWGIHLYHYANNVTVANNTSFNNGAGGFVIGASGTTNDYTIVENNISVWNNGNGYNAGWGFQEREGDGAHNIYRNNLSYGNSGGDFSLLNGLSATNSVLANPQFVNYTGISTGNYRLQSSSPAIDAGTGTSAPAKDADGGPRPTGNSWDIGAFEYGTTGGNWPTY